MPKVFSYVKLSSISVTPRNRVGLATGRGVMALPNAVTLGHLMAFGCSCITLWLLELGDSMRLFSSGAVCSVELQAAAYGKLGPQNSQVSTLQVFQLMWGFGKQKRDVGLKWGQGKDLQGSSESGDNTQGGKW